jgi:hypothetical protein
MRAIGLVLLSIAIMALLLTDADAKRRSSAQGSQSAAAEAGARPIPGKASTTTAVLPRNNSVWPRFGGSVAFADPIRFPGRRMGAATPGQVRCARAKVVAGGSKEIVGQVQVFGLGPRHCAVIGFRT